jgi:hypothetical protein
MPPQLTTMLSALGVSASFGEFAGVQGILGGSFSKLAETRRNRVAQVDAADMTPKDITHWLAELPIGRQDALRIAWMADRLGASMSFGTFADNVGDLWFPAMDDIVAVLPSGGQLMVLVLDHEELITFSSVECPSAPGEDRA